MKLVIDCRTINLVIASGISHKKLLITPSSHFSFPGAVAATTLSKHPSLAGIQRRLCPIRWQRALEGQVSGAVAGKPQGSQCSESGEVSWVKCLLLHAPGIQCPAPECSCRPSTAPGTVTACTPAPIPSGLLALTAQSTEAVSMYLGKSSLQNI